MARYRSEREDYPSGFYGFNHPYRSGYADDDRSWRSRGRSRFNADENSYFSDYDDRESSYRRRWDSEDEDRWDSGYGRDNRSRWDESGYGWNKLRNRYNYDDQFDRGYGDRRTNYRSGRSRYPDDDIPTWNRYRERDNKYSYDPDDRGYGSRSASYEEDDDFDQLGWYENERSDYRSDSNRYRDRPAGRSSRRRYRGENFMNTGNYGNRHSSRHGDADFDLSDRWGRDRRRYSERY